mmetsp:Transcript_23405/g.28869  ORF Transcript_23405/g.28869 Transcript_23405/m.28869 type:complete len:416 (-) Transcript_23405:560-1807(-)
MELQRLLCVCLYFTVTLGNVQGDKNDQLTCKTNLTSVPMAGQLANVSLSDICISSCYCEEEQVLVEPPADAEENVALAFGLVAASGLSTTFGAAMVFSDRLFHVANNSVLGAALGFSGGVMLYVSFVEIFQKSVTDFEKCDCLWDGADENESAAYVMATICFFCGVVIMYVLNFVVHKISHCAGHGHSHDPPSLFTSESAGSKLKPTRFDVEDAGAPRTLFDEAAVEAINDAPDNEGIKDADAHRKDSVDEASIPDETILSEKKRLSHMGSMTALAIGLHNFPEGLATFVATLGDPAVGVSLAVAIAIHNIPEGLCVSIPVYYATGSRWKGFCMAFWSGVTEIIGAALGYAFLKEILGPSAYAALFGLVAGMMVTIVIKELLPTAHRYDPNDKYVTNCVFLGAFVMALSLCLFVV